MLASLLDAVAPRRCAGCDRAAPDVLCEPCVEAAVALPAPRPRREPYGVALAALPFEGGVRRAVHVGKYRGGRRALRLLAVVAAERLAPILAARGGCDAVVPVPLGRRRRRRRGYNQAAVVAVALAALPGAGEVVDGLRRRRETPSQVGRDAAARHRQLEGAFTWAGPPLTGARVWLVDDVLTTGATLRAAARALQQAGASRIEGVTALATPPPRRENARATVRAADTGRACAGAPPEARDPPPGG